MAKEKLAKALEKDLKKKKRIIGIYFMKIRKLGEKEDEMSQVACEE